MTTLTSEKVNVLGQYLSAVEFSRRYVPHSKLNIKSASIWFLHTLILFHY